MDLKITAIAVILFFVLSPTVLLRFPSSGNKYVVAGTHALIFGLLFHLAQTFTQIESFVEGATGICANFKSEDCTTYDNCVWNDKLKKCRDKCSSLTKKQCNKKDICSWDGETCNYKN
jgi:hypothetical protein